MNFLYIALSAFVGGVATAFLGFLDSQQEFQIRKFCASIIRSCFAAVIIAVAFEYSDDMNPIDIALAFLGGAGIDVIGNRTAGILRRR